MRLKRLFVTQIVLCFCILGHTAFGQTTEFTYQGSLKNTGAPANGNFDFEFALFDALSDGNQVGSTVALNNVVVTNGIFAVKIDFGSQFPGADRFLEIRVRPTGGGAFTPLTPRQPLMSTPYSVRSLNASTADSLSSTGSGNFIQNSTTQQTASFNITGDGMAGGMLAGNIINAGTQFQISGAQMLAGNLFTNNTFVGIGAGVSNTTGDQNTFVGRGTGPGNLTGNNNTFVGAAAGNANKGSNNTAVGRFSGLSITTGSNNTLIGANSNVSSPTLSYATAIGSDAVVGTDNTIVIGRSGGQDTVQVPGMITGKGAVPWQVVSGPSQQAQPNNGYLATNDAQVTITLPANPNVGDIVRASGIGAGGWKVVGNTGQFILPSITSTGENWIPHETIRNWESVASSADGTKLVAAYNKPGGQILTSNDSGTTWIPRPPFGPWKGVASSADGTRLAAVLSGQIQISSDSGATWTPRGPGLGWQSIASSADGQKLVALAYGSPIYLSTDFGQTWTPNVSTPSVGWASVASSADGTKLIAAAQSDGGPNQFPEFIYLSNNSGATWTPVNALGGAHWWIVASSGNGNTLIALNQSAGSNWVSTDSGANWTRREIDKSWYRAAVSNDGTRLVTVVYGGQIYTSNDSGVTWRVRESVRNWNAVASSADGLKLIAAGGPGQIYTATILDVPNGRASYVAGGQNSAVELQYVGNGLFLPISQIGSTTAFY